MANATQLQYASKFFAAPAREVLVFSEEDFETLIEFKEAITDQISTLAAQGVELRFQHKGFVRGNVWSIDITKLQKYCDSVGARLLQFGKPANNYVWRIIPRASVLTKALF